MIEFIGGAYQYCLNVGLYTHTLACTFVQSSKCMYNYIKHILATIRLHSYQQEIEVCMYV